MSQTQSSTKTLPSLWMTMTALMMRARARSQLFAPPSILNMGKASKKSRRSQKPLRSAWTKSQSSMSKLTHSSKSWMILRPRISVETPSAKMDTILQTKKTLLKKSKSKSTPSLKLKELRKLPLRSWSILTSLKD